MAREKLRIGIIGLGIISDGHIDGAAAMSDIATIAAVCDLDEAKARTVAERFGAAVYTDYEKLIDEADVDLVDIILPHNLHYPVAMYALERGKHVQLEKPLTIDPSEGWELIEKAREMGVKFTVAENTRFITAYIEAKKLLDAGELGEIYHLRTLIAGSEVERLHQGHPWKAKIAGSGGGVLLDAAAHTFYLLKWLFGGVNELQAFATQTIGTSEVEDNALVRGRLVGGIDFVSQFSFTSESPWTERLEIYGTTGALIIDQIVDPPAKLYRGEHDYYGTPLESVPFAPDKWKLNSIYEETRDFIQTVWDDGTPKVDPVDAHYALLVIRKAYESTRSGGQRLSMKS